MVTNKQVMEMFQAINARLDGFEAANKALSDRIEAIENQAKTAPAPKKAKGKKESSEADRTYTKRTPDQLKRWHAEYDARWAKWTKDGTVKHDHAANSRRNREICKELKELGF